MRHCIKPAIAAAILCVAGPSGYELHQRPTGPRIAQTAVKLPASATYPPRQLTCLARAMWFEAGNQPRRGQVAVGEVILRRTHDPHFPTDPCGVVAQRNQFSFVHHGIIPSIPLAADAQAMEDLARRVVDGTERSGIARALFFHARYVHPRWNYIRVGMIGEHIFYTAAGTTPAA